MNSGQRHNSGDHSSLLSNERKGKEKKNFFFSFNPFQLGLFCVGLSGSLQKVDGLGMMTWSEMGMGF